MTYCARIGWVGGACALLGACVLPGCGGRVAMDDDAVGAVDQTTDEVACQGDLEPRGPNVVLREATLDEPFVDPRGGALADGTYDLTAYLVWADVGSSLQVARTAIRVRQAGTRFDYVEGSGDSAVRYTGAIDTEEPDGIWLRYSLICPVVDDEGPLAARYTASADRILLYGGYGAPTALVYERRR